MELTLLQIENILKNHGIDFSRVGGTFFIKDPAHEEIENISYKKLNTASKIKNWLGY